LRQTIDDQATKLHKRRELFLWKEVEGLAGLFAAGLPLRGEEETSRPRKLPMMFGRPKWLKSKIGTVLSAEQG